MLEELNVDGYALIDKLTVRFTNGLNILSGETGAGKSIIVGALSLILGEKADASSIRSGNKECAVSGVIRVNSNENVLQWLSEHDINAEDNSIIIRRILKSSGRGQIYIQSTPVTRTDVKELTSLLFDMHGQHEHQSLLRIETHRELLDRFGGHEDMAISLNKVFRDLSEKRKQYESLSFSEQQRLRERDMLEFSIKEIEEASLMEGEKEEIVQEISVLSQREKLLALLGSFHERLAESKGAALALFREALRDIEGIAAIDPELSGYSERLTGAFYEIEDIVDSIRQYQDSIDFSPGKLESLEERLAQIRKLEKKYGTNILAVLAYAEECKVKLARVENLDEEKVKLESEIKTLEKNLWAAARDLSDCRKKSSEVLEKQIQKNLQLLGMPKAGFLIEMRNKTTESGNPVCGPHGIDIPEFLISPNQGEPPRPLRQIVSGGEMSRIMLAIKSVLSDTDYIQSVIFDEIDAGIGGEVAVSVGEHLQKLAAHKQILCITHLATIAVQADNHIKVEKLIRGDRTLTTATEIVGKQKVSEIARMLSGDSSEETSLAHAGELLKKVGKLA